MMKVTEDLRYPRLLELNERKVHCGEREREGRGGGKDKTNRRPRRPKTNKKKPPKDTGSKHFPLSYRTVLTKAGISDVKFPVVEGLGTEKNKSLNPNGDTKGGHKTRERRI